MSYSFWPAEQQFFAGTLTGKSPQQAFALPAKP